MQAVLTAAERIKPADVDSEIANRQEKFEGVSGHEGCLILVAEDYEANQRVILYQLEQLGYKADVANDGEEALKYLRKGKYSALLTDLHMPNLDGYELARQIRSEETGEKRLPIIAMTANTLKGEEQRCIKLGMDAYLSKPARLRDINAILERFISVPNKKTKPQLEEASSIVPPIDVNVLKEFVGDDPDMIRSLLRQFSVSADKSATELELALSEGNIAAAVATAHRLKSSAKSVGAFRLAVLCERIESVESSGEISMLKSLFVELNKELTVVHAALDSTD